jgi:chromosome transmission fidelity protein 8
MPTVPLYPPSLAGHNRSVSGPLNPLPQLLQTPSGLAILEVQGTINIPSPRLDSDIDTSTKAGTYTQSPLQFQTPIGRLIFPDYGNAKDPGNTGWMKRVYLYVGRHQRLSGEVKKLPKPLAVLRRRQTDAEKTLNEGIRATRDEYASASYEDEGGDQLEIVEIVKYRILFSSRPEPVSDISEDVR